MDQSSAPWRVLDEEPADRIASTDAPAPATVPWRAAGGVVLAATLAIGAFMLAASAPPGDVTVQAQPGGSAGPSALDSTPGSVPPAIVVDVQGAVVHPGVRHLDKGARVGDAIDAAGGFSARVDASRAGRELNLAALLSDGDRVVVPSRDDPAPQGVGAGGGLAPGSSGGGESGQLVDLNSATPAELDELPGIGPKTAQKIIDARTEKPFASVEELRDRKIVGASVFERLADLVTVH